MFVEGKAANVGVDNSKELVVTKWVASELGRCGGREDVRIRGWASKSECSGALYPNFAFSNFFKSVNRIEELGQAIRTSCIRYNLASEVTW